jgi:hypothetical protein
MKNLQSGAAWAAVAVFALLLVTGGAVSALAVRDEVEGKVLTFEKGKSIEIQVGDAKKEFKVDDKTEVKGEVAVGKTVKVTVSEGTATKIEVKE